MEISEALDMMNKVYIHGKWALETLSMMSADA
jgi:hypothetical protein